MMKVPRVRRDEAIVDKLHGVAVPDPYRALEDPDAAETKAFVDQQNALFKTHMDRIGFKESFKSRLTEMYNFERFGCPFKRGDQFFFFRNSGLQAQNVLYKQQSLTSAPVEFFDPNKLAADGSISLNTYSFSKHGKYFGYALSNSGSDWVNIHVKRVLDSVEVGEPVRWGKHTSIAWTHDQEGFFYSRYPQPENVTTENAGTETSASKNMSIYYHTVGTPQSLDIHLFNDSENPDHIFSAEVTDCGKYLLISTFKSCDPENLLHIADLPSSFSSGTSLNIRPLVAKWEAYFSYLTNEGPVLFFKTTLNAPKYKIVKYDLLQPDLGFVDVVPEAGDSIDFVTVVDHDKLVIVFLKDVVHVIKVFSLLTGQELPSIQPPLPPGCIIKSITGRKEDSEMFYSFAGYTQPGAIYRYEFPTRMESIFKEVSVANFSSADFKTEQVFYESDDGTKIPLFIFHRKDVVLDGTNPTLLYGYGGFNISMTPRFAVSWLTFIETFGGIVAVASIRGGGEYGKDWYDGGRLKNKQNVFTDFQCAAKYLIANNYTSPSKLAINGGSNGGLLVAACVNQAPELFSAVVADVGVLDVVRFHKFTIGAAWKSDYGDPDVESDFQTLIKYSPLHNISKDKTYPSILLTTSDHDDRVSPLHSLKFIATLQHEARCHGDGFFIRVDVKSGHGAGKPTEAVIEEATDKFCFIAHALHANVVGKL